MTYTTNILAVPLVIAMWTLDIYLILIMLRWILHRFPSQRTSDVQKLLIRLTAPPQQIAKRVLGRCFPANTKPWIPWLLIVVVGLAARHILVNILVSLG